MLENSTSSVNNINIDLDIDIDDSGHYQYRYRIDLKIRLSLSPDGQNCTFWDSLLIGCWHVQNYTCYDPARC